VEKLDFSTGALTQTYYAVTYGPTFSASDVSYYALYVWGDWIFGGSTNFSSLFSKDIGFLAGLTTNRATEVNTEVTSIVETITTTVLVEVTLSKTWASQVVAPVTQTITEGNYFYFNKNEFCTTYTNGEIVVSS
jgi:hypothetical protein